MARKATRRGAATRVSRPDAGTTDESAAIRDRRRAGRRELEAMIEAVLAIEERRVILVDGFNVLHAVLLKEEREAGWWRRKQRERLLERVSSWPEQEDEIWVAFDGAEPSWSVWAEPVATIRSRGAQSRETQPTQRRPTGLADPPPAAEPGDAVNRPGVVHALHVESADDWIVRRARRTPHPERTVVVTADRQVAGRARSAGCEIWTPWAFMSRCPALSLVRSSPESQDHPE